MDLRQKRIGFALTGSFCTLAKVMKQLEAMAQLGADIYPIMSETVWATDTRFGTAQSFREKMEQITGKEIIHTICSAEPIGPRRLLDCVLIAPCTGNTLSKIAHGITDTCVAMAAKANLRNGCPLIIAPSTNDGLGASAPNIGTLLGRTNIYFVPFGQDDPVSKPDSLVANMDLIIPTVSEALDHRQLQPILAKGD